MSVNTLRPRQNGRHFPDNIFNCICLNENVRISLEISPKFVPRHLINNTPALVQIMAWRRPGDKPLSEPMVVSLLTHICVTRPQWVKTAQTTANCLTFYCGLQQKLSKFHIAGPLWGKFTSDQWIPLTKIDYCRKHFLGIMSLWHIILNRGYVKTFHHVLATG